MSLLRNRNGNVVLALLILLAACSIASAQKLNAEGRDACAANRKGEAANWRVYLDQANRFCFLYPRAYAPIPHPKPDCRGPKLRNKTDAAIIGVCVIEKPFTPDNLVEMAPTGYDSPPPPLVAGKNTFYYYGPGGGGVSYPDGYYFNLRNQILLIYFDGPYNNDKTPTHATKEMAKKLLATFVEF